MANLNEEVEGGMMSRPAQRACPKQSLLRDVRGGAKAARTALATRKANGEKRETDNGPKRQTLAQRAPQSKVERPSVRICSPSSIQIIFRLIVFFFREQ